ncbi:hypothetical protein QFZ30_003850 [Arthrobacter pascens]|nr:hypothetical protein [Arthrobacter pascens]
MRSELTFRDFPGLRTRAFSGAGDEEAFETKASPPAVAGPLAAGNRPPAIRPGMLSCR